MSLETVINQNGLSLIPRRSDITVNSFRLPTGANTGYVLTSDINGNGTWTQVDVKADTIATGTANQVLINGDTSPHTGNLTFTTPQNIGTSSSPTFAAMTLGGNLTMNGLTASNYVKTNGSKVLTSSATIPAGDITGLGATAPVTYSAGNIALNITGANLQITGSNLNTIQNIGTGASPTFVNSTFTGLGTNQFVKTDGSKSLTSTATITPGDITGLGATVPVTYSAGNIALGYNTTNLKLTSNNLNTIQDITTSSRPGFAGLDSSASIIESTGTSAISLAQSDPVFGAFLRNDGINFVVSTNVGSLYLGYGGNLSKIIHLGSGSAGVVQINGNASAGILAINGSGVINLGNISASQYLKTDGSKNLTSVATIPTSDITNFAVDVRALFNVGSNSFLGVNALSGITSGTFNVCMGYESALSLTSGSNNVSYGYQSFRNGTAASGCSAIGFQSSANTTGNDCSSLGYKSQFANTSGSRNTSSGSNSLLAVISGNDNSVLGYNAGSTLTTGSNCVCLGSGADVKTNSDVYSLVLGAGATGNGSNTMTVGSNSISSAVGTSIMYYNSSTGLVSYSATHLPSASTYTPTITINSVGISSTGANVTNYTRVGNTITVSGYLSFTTSGVTSTQLCNLYVSLPVSKATPSFVGISGTANLFADPNGNTAFQQDLGSSMCSVGGDPLNGTRCEINAVRLAGNNFTLGTQYYLGFILMYNVT